jgi:hypothetical protein
MVKERIALEDLRGKQLAVDTNGELGIEPVLERCNRPAVLERQCLARRYPSPTVSPVLTHRQRR